MKHGVIYGLGGIAQQSVALLLLPIYTRHLTPEIYGILSLLMISLAIMVSIFTFGIDSALFRSYYDYEESEKKTEVVTTAFYMLLASSAVLIVSGYFLSPVLSRWIFGSGEYVSYLYVIIGVAFFQVHQNLFLSIMRAQKHSKEYAFYNFSLFFLKLIFIAYLVLVAKKGIWGILWGEFISIALLAGTFFLKIRPSLKITFSFLESSKMLNFGLPLIPANMAGFVLMMSDKFFIKYFLGIREVGLYSLSCKFGMIIMVFLLMPFKLIWPPMIFSVEKEAYAKEFYAKILTYFVFFGIFISLAVSLLSKDIIQMISDRSFWPASRVVPLICLSYVFFGAQEALNVGINLKRKTVFCAVVLLSGAVINLALNYLLIPPYGMIGAAFATLLSFLIMCALNYHISTRLYPIAYEWKRIGQLLAIGGLLYGLGVSVNPEHLWGRIGTKLLLIISYPGWLFVFKFFEKQEWNKIQTFFRKKNNESLSIYKSKI